MDERESAEDGNYDVEPPEGPQRVNECFPTETVVLVDETDGDVDEGGGTHGIGAQE